MSKPERRDKIGRTNWGLWPAKRYNENRAARLDRGTKPHRPRERQKRYLKSGPESLVEGVGSLTQLP